MNTNIELKTRLVGEYLEVTITYEGSMCWQGVLDLDSDQAKDLLGEIESLKEDLEDFTYKHWHKEMRGEIERHGGG